MNAFDALALSKDSMKDEANKILERIKLAAKKGEREIKIPEPSAGLEAVLRDLGYIVTSRGKGFNRSFYIKW